MSILSYSIVPPDDAFDPRDVFRHLRVHHGYFFVIFAIFPKGLDPELRVNSDGFVEVS